MGGQQRVTWCLLVVVGTAVRHTALLEQCVVCCGGGGVKDEDGWCSYLLPFTPPPPHKTRLLVTVCPPALAQQPTTHLCVMSCVQSQVLLLHARHHTPTCGGLLCQSRRCITPCVGCDHHTYLTCLTHSLYTHSPTHLCVVTLCHTLCFVTLFLTGSTSLLESG